jgi:hypothetical protein
MFLPSVFCLLAARYIIRQVLSLFKLSALLQIMKYWQPYIQRIQLRHLLCDSNLGYKPWLCTMTKYRYSYWNWTDTLNYKQVKNLISIRLTAQKQYLIPLINAMFVWSAGVLQWNVTNNLLVIGQLRGKFIGMDCNRPTDTKSNSSTNNFNCWMEPRHLQTFFWAQLMELLDITVSSTSTAAAVSNYNNTLTFF